MLDDYSLLARALRALIDSWTLSVDWGESNNKLEEELSELDEDELLDGVRTAELEGFQNQNGRKILKGVKSKKRLKNDGNLRLHRNFFF